MYITNGHSRLANVVVDVWIVLEKPTKVDNDYIYNVLREIVNQFMNIGNNDEWLRYMYVGEFLFNQRGVFLVSRK